MDLTSERILQKYYLDMDYKPQNISYENHTNMLINNIINDFIKEDSEYTERYNKQRTYVLLYHDDIISTICYRILKNIQSIHPINLYLFGTKKKTKQYIDKEDKFISKRKVKEIYEKTFTQRNNDSIIEISPFNPLYKVADFKSPINNSRLLVVQGYFYEAKKIMRHFTPQELAEAQKFYHIGYIKNDFIDLTKINSKDINESLYDYIKLCEGKELDVKLFDYYSTFNNLYCKPDKIIFLKMTDNLEENIKLLQEVQDEDGLVLYYTKEDKMEKAFPGYDSEFGMWVKHKYNIPNYLNTDVYDVDGLFYMPSTEFVFSGVWEDKDKNFILNQREKHIYRNCEGDVIYGR